MATEHIARLAAIRQAQHEPPANSGPAWPVLAEEAFHGLAGHIAKTIEPHTESDPAFVLLNTHTFFGNAIGRGPHYVVESSAHFPNIYCAFVGRTSKARKGTGDGRTRQIFAHADTDWYRRRIHSTLSSGEGVIWEVRDPITKRVKDKNTGLMIEETIDEGVSDKRLLVVQSEFSGALQVMHREGSILSAVLRDAWDTGNLGTLTKTSPARATGAHVSIVGHITQIELRAMLDRIAMANGFGNRFLMALVRRSNVLPFGGSLTPIDVSKLGAQVAQTIERARKITRVNWSPEGAEGWAEIYPGLSQEQPGLFGALTARAEAQTVRLALIYALWDGADQIALPHLTAAIALWNYCRDSVRYIFGDSLGDPTADAILAALKIAGPSGLTRTDISELFSRNASASQIARALKELQEIGLAAMRQAPMSRDGRPPEIWIYRGSQ